MPDSHSNALFDAQAKQKEQEMEIKVLGTGCPKCKKLEEITREAVAEAGVEATITKVDKLGQIMEYPITSTPGLVIDEELKVSGRLPRKQEIMAWLQEAE
jgi:small redox-active disulfide protein 2